MVDLEFPLRGQSIPADHSYALFSALCQLVPLLHDDARIGVRAISGRIERPRRIALTETSRLRLRVPVAHISACIALAGQGLEIDGAAAINLGFPTIAPLLPVASVYSRLVTIHGFMESVSFLEAARRQLDNLGIHAYPSLLPRPTGGASCEGTFAASRDPWVRRTVRIRDKNVVGYALRVEGLEADESLRLQERGLGGRRHFGCGIFVNSKRG